MSPLISKGLNLALYGMGTVFVFLTMLVFVTMFMSWLVLKFSPVQEAEQVVSSNQSKKMAAITAAIHAHRSKQG